MGPCACNAGLVSFHFAVRGRCCCKPIVARSESTCLNCCSPLLPKPLQLSLQVAARIAYESYCQALSTTTGRCGPFAFQSSLFVPTGAPIDYSGAYPPQPMLQLQDLRHLEVGGCAGWAGVSISIAVYSLSMVNH